MIGAKLTFVKKMDKLIEKQELLTNQKQIGLTKDLVISQIKDIRNKDKEIVYEDNLVRQLIENAQVTNTTIRFAFKCGVEIEVER